MCSTSAFLAGIQPEVFDSVNYPSHPHRRPPVPLVTRAAHAATAAYQRAVTSKRERLYQQENQRLRQENTWLRNEVRHCWDAIDVMGHDMEARRREFVLGELSRVDAHRRTAVVDQRHLLEVHLREQLAAELEDALLQGFETGYKAGLADRRRSRPPRAQRRRLTGDS
ncbi:hypothetical protein [Salinispora arenicola]|uniref:hypothetical protein n=1 Tax=Salinispora arenicola TaxID=168697 RepID=UPI00038288D2|nr:hypothetical protein [Salinispora arenicola]